MKPDLSMYVGKRVVAITRGQEAHEWGIKLQGNVEIRNKSLDETMAPIGLVGAYFASMTLSLHDTVMHFDNGEKFSFSPLKYTLYDPAYGSEVFPQWSEDLTLKGIHPEAAEGRADELEAQDAEVWQRREQELEAARQARVGSQAQEFLKEEEQT